MVWGELNQWGGGGVTEKIPLLYCSCSATTNDLHLLIFHAEWTDRVNS